MAWRLAKSLDVLRKQINETYPKRNKSSDGTIGDAKHAASQSEHNPDRNGVVRALDITHDPAHGVHARQIADALVASRDPRILYIISNSQIVRSYPRSGSKPWSWSPYFGANPHTKHFHISVSEDRLLYDKIALWSLPKSVIAPSEVNHRIVATMFSDTRLAYQNVLPGHLDRPGVALPFRFEGARPKVRIWRSDDPSTAVIADVIDVGPWNVTDNYWDSGRRPQAESGTIKVGPNAGKKSNKAGIDVTPKLNTMLNLMGKGLVDWEIVK